MKWLAGYALLSAILIGMAESGNNAATMAKMLIFSIDGGLLLIKGEQMASGVKQLLGGTE